jgi:hypothetical protein
MFLIIILLVTVSSVVLNSAQSPHNYYIKDIEDKNMVESSQFGLSFERRPNNDIYLTPTGEHKWTLIWMHGLGDSSDGFLDFFFTHNSVVPNQVSVKIPQTPNYIEHKSDLAECSKAEGDY